MTTRIADREGGRHARTTRPDPIGTLARDVVELLDDARLAALVVIVLTTLALGALLGALLF